ncbi:uncharacterized protein N7458_001017 [Penicillium daleae]|uniref:Uncharacterized protein n=1 Tax=Penicillium daleae TaxID=63821 RepID=A0AAD6CH81_9EURO|nr:uncharacterized protein N7458_001017 [Penicillium daleae]KAJ5465331.1 hypothetical protein N7458_001017 [Penicillium daleae]
MTESTFQANILFDFAEIQAHAQASTTANRSAINADSYRPSSRAPKSKVITGPPKSLYLPRLCYTDDIGSFLIVRRESPRDTYQPVFTYDGAGKVTIDTRCSRPSRMVAIRKYPKQDTRWLIGRFGGFNIEMYFPCWSVTSMLISLFSGGRFEVDPRPYHSLPENSSCRVRARMYYGSSR